VELNLYKKYQNKLRTGDLLSWSSDSVLGSLIQWFTNSDINHSGMVIRFQDYEETDAQGRRFTLEAVRGVELHLISRQMEGYKGSLYWHKLQDRFEDKRSLLGAVSLQYVGVDYDYSSLFKNAISRVSTNANKLFCSEYVYLTFKQCGFSLEVTDPELIVQLADGKAPTPADMHKLGWWDDRIKIG